MRTGKWILAAAIAVGLVTPTLLKAASDRQDDIQRIQNATAVFREIMQTPDKSIPTEILGRAQCIAIIPGQKKAAFGIGGTYGKGLVTCRSPRTASGWSAPLFITVGGGSFGFQIGGQSSDVVMVFQNRSGVESLLSNKFKVGADANAAAGPVGRHAEAATDVALNAQILTYSRSKGAFAGVSLNGAVVQPDDTGNAAMYGQNPNKQQILTGHTPVPASAQPLVRELARFKAAQRAKKAANQ